MNADPNPVDCNCGKVIRIPDLNVLPEDLMPEETAVPVHPQQEPQVAAVPVHPQQRPQVAADGGLLFTPIIDVEAIEEECLMLSSSTGIQQAVNPYSIEHQVIDLDKDHEFYEERKAGRECILNADTYPVDCNCGKVILTLDLNVLPEDLRPEESVVPVHLQQEPQVAAVPVHPQQGPQVAANGSLLCPSIIDVEVMKEVYLTLCNSSWFQQAINSHGRKRQVIDLDKDLEFYEGRKGFVFENQMPTMSLNSHNIHERIPANLKDDYNVKRKRAMSPSPEPARAEVTQKEPTFCCPVCLNELVDACSTNCGHVFCEGCIKNSIKKLKKCPTCRKSLKMKSFHRVYLPAANHSD